jgi:excisionase family DNA binding protein
MGKGTVRDGHAGSKWERDMKKSEVSTEMTEARRLLTAAQACEFLQVGRTTLWRMVRDGDIGYISVRGRKRFHAGDLLESLIGDPKSDTN